MLNDRKCLSSRTSWEWLWGWSSRGPSLAWMLLWGPKSGCGSSLSCMLILGLNLDWRLDLLWARLVDACDMPTCWARSCPSPCLLTHARPAWDLSNYVRVNSSVLLSSLCDLRPKSRTKSIWLRSYPTKLFRSSTLWVSWSTLRLKSTWLRGSGRENCLEPNCTWARVSLEVYTGVYVEPWLVSAVARSGLWA